MLDAQEIQRQLAAMNADAAEVLAQDKAANHETYWRGFGERSRNLERIYKLAFGAAFEQDAQRRIEALEQEVRRRAANRQEADGQPTQEP
jgi:hypothetical protein